MAMGINIENFTTFLIFTTNISSSKRDTSYKQNKTISTTH